MTDIKVDKKSGKITAKQVIEDNYGKTVEKYELNKRTNSWVLTEKERKEIIKS